ncbi:hypothetical protein [Candidatus Thiodiazotropha endoloripes]|uniref:hypothetical protein n=1 Tax=Candidatus Thiodiazotropha endoloripes TaxID=1818881 RepID=UPI00114CC2D3|nr:hypothetical protein [Candidatus Thiodiazotropha endoloripes]MCG7984531.1 hypothetical protein [Candidatus Thiodiazotropha lotti]
MKSDIDEFNWHKIDAAAAEKLSTLINSPGVVYPIDNTLLPEKIKKMTGVSSYYATGYSDVQAHSSMGLVAGELVVARQDSSLIKNYNYVFGVSSDSNVYFSGPYKGFGHHASSEQTVEVNSLFGQTPYGKNHF